MSQTLFLGRKSQRSLSRFADTSFRKLANVCEGNRPKQTTLCPTTSQHQPSATFRHLVIFPSHNFQRLINSWPSKIPHSMDNRSFLLQLLLHIYPVITRAELKLLVVLLVGVCLPDRSLLHFCCNNELFYGRRVSRRGVVGPSGQWCGEEASEKARVEGGTFLTFVFCFRLWVRFINVDYNPSVFPLRSWEY